MQSSVHQAIFVALTKERQYQDRKYGTPDRRQLSIAAYLVIMQYELHEAMSALVTKNNDEAMIELLQVAATAVAAMEVHGVHQRPDIDRTIFF